MVHGGRPEPLLEGEGVERRVPQRKAQPHRRAPPGQERGPQGHGARQGAQLLSARDLPLLPVTEVYERVGLQNRDPDAPGRAQVARHHQGVAGDLGGRAPGGPSAACRGAPKSNRPKAPRGLAHKGGKLAKAPNSAHCGRCLDEWGGVVWASRFSPAPNLPPKELHGLSTCELGRHLDTLRATRKELL